MSMTKNQRINLLVSAEERADIDARAARAGVTVSEFLRRAALAYEPEVDLEALALLAEEAGAAIDRMAARLDEAHAHLAASRLRPEEIEAIREEAQRDFEAAPFTLPQLRSAAAKLDAEVRAENA